VTRIELRRLTERAIAKVQVDHGLLDHEAPEFEAVRTVSRKSSAIACGGMCAYDRDNAIVVDCLVRQAGLWKDFEHPSKITKALADAWDDLAFQVTGKLGSTVINICAE
jgi:hypothetical protein